MKKKISNTETKEKIEKFFSEIKTKSQREIKKIEKLSAKNKIPIKEYKKFFCKKCLLPFQGNEKIRIKNGFKTIECKSCREIRRIKLR